MARATSIDSIGDGIETTGDIGSGPVDAFGSVGLDFGGSDNRDSGGDFDPAIHAGRDKLNADGSYRKKRGRKPGSSSASGGKKSAPSVNTIETSLVGIHAMLAMITKAPELMLDDDESRPLAGAIAEVAKHYDIPGLDAVVVAWVGLVMVAGKIYVPRAIMINTRLKETAKPRLSKPAPAANNSEPQSETAPFVMPFDPLNPTVL